MTPGGIQVVVVVVHFRIGHVFHPGRSDLIKEGIVVPVAVVPDLEYVVQLVCDCHSQSGQSAVLVGPHEDKVIVDHY